MTSSHLLRPIPVMLSVVLLLSLLIAYAFRPINPADYPERLDYGILTAAEQVVFNEILSAVEADTPIVYVDEPIDHYRLLTHLGLYYGSLKNVGSLFVVSNGNIHLNLESFSEFERNRSDLNAIVDEALTHIREGSPRYKLWQAAHYLADNYDYIRSEFVCSDYTMLFYKIASRLGIETYVCFGYATDELHTWNMVELDGKQYYYDITWFDGPTRNREYLHSSTSWGREIVVNDMWKVFN